MLPLELQARGRSPASSDCDGPLVQARKRYAFAPFAPPAAPPRLLSGAGPSSDIPGPSAFAPSIGFLPSRCAGLRPAPASAPQNLRFCGQSSHPSCIEHTLLPPPSASSAPRTSLLAALPPLASSLMAADSSDPYALRPISALGSPQACRDRRDQLLISAVPAGTLANERSSWAKWVAHCAQWGTHPLAAQPPGLQPGTRVQR